MSRKLSIILVGVALLTAACGSDAETTELGTDTTQPTATNPDSSQPESTDPTTTDSQTPDAEEPDTDVALTDDTIVLAWTENGGCVQAGPNCARYEVTADGTTMTYRVGEDDVGIPGTVDRSLVDAWVAVAAGTDQEALLGRLGPGEMTAAFDGVDFELAAPFIGVELSSVDVEFSQTEEFFQTATALADAAAVAAPLPLEMR